HVWTVDPHDLPGYRTTTGNGPVRNRIDYTDPKHRRLAERQVRNSGHGDRITMIRDFSQDAGRAWTGPKVGLLFIDGNHYERHVRLDFTAWERHLAPGAIVCFDDHRAAFPGVINVVARLVEKGVITEPTLVGSLAVTSRR
ncbi:MAG TPA: class I SAM-dependent methyltransferase, partial [Jiangellaceae bacterium]|nr:class I SAM-dependent methyltransferase [Jiangellaceae bacterium]